MKRLQIGVIGSASNEEYSYVKPDQNMFGRAEELGRLLAQGNSIVVNGGKGGVMEAVSRGARAADGIVVAEISGAGRLQGNEFVDVEIVTNDVGFRGPSLLVGMCDVLISIGGGAGTLQELAVAYRLKKPVVLLTGYGGWTDKIAELDYLDERKLIRFASVTTVEKAVEKAYSLVEWSKA